MKVADGHTRQADEGALGLKDEYFVRLLADLGVDRARVQLDPFSQKEFAKAPRWFSKYSAPGSAGVDGFILPWINEDGSKAFCFVNEQFKDMGRILRKVMWEQTDCVLVTPGWPKYWVSMLQDLPITKTVPIVPNTITVGGKKVQESLFVRGSRATEGARNAYWKMYAHLVEYSSLQSGVRELRVRGSTPESLLGPMRRDN